MPVPLKEAKHYEKVECPSCKTSVFALSEGLYKRTISLTDSKIFNLINSTSKGLVLRVFSATKNETFEKKGLSTCELARYLIKSDGTYKSYRQCKKVNQKFGWHERNDCAYHYQSEHYTKNLRSELSDTDYKYCNIDLFATNERNIDVIRYLLNYQIMPGLEHLVTAKMNRLI